MTFSIVAVSEDREWLGVAVASRVLAVGRAVQAAAVGAGAIATQAHCNMTYRPRGIELLKTGMSAPDVMAALLAEDPGPDGRQVGIVDRDRVSATYTGPNAWDWAGGLTGPGYAIQGNILAGKHVVEAMERAWLSTTPDEPFNRRLVKALLAGDRAGADGGAGVLVRWRWAVPIALSGVALIAVFAVVSYFVPAAGVSDIGTFAGKPVHRKNALAAVNRTPERYCVIGVGSRTVPLA